MARILLVLDDRPEVGRGLKRLLKRRFDEILLASTPEEAEGLMAREEGAPTHLLCDYFLGEGGPIGVDLIPRWRREYPSLRAVALLSGVQIDPARVPDGVDAVFEKPVDPAVLIAFLDGDGC